MNYTTILMKGKDLLLWIYTNITNKFTKVFKKLIDKFPVLNRYPLLKYSLIPLFVVVILLLRYIINYVINEIATWTSNFVRETSGYSISERTIVLSIAALIIILRIVVLFNKQKRKSQTNWN